MSSKSDNIYQASGCNDEIGDMNAYIATLGPNEREELAFADAAIDIAVLLYRTRER